MAMDEKGLTVKRRGKTETIRAIIVAVGVSERVGPAGGCRWRGWRSGLSIR
jgi:hypothetical protein